MQAEQLASQIIADAKQRAEQIEDEGQKSLALFKDETRSLVAGKRKHMRDAARELEQREEQRQRARIQQKATMQMLEVRQELLEVAFTKAAKKLTTISGKKRTAFLQQLWDRARKHMKIGSVVVAAKDAAFFKRRAKVTGRHASAGGFIATSTDGNISLDLTFETLLADVRERSIQDVAAVLFQEKH